MAIKQLELIRDQKYFQMIQELPDEKRNEDGLMDICSLLNIPVKEIHKYLSIGKKAFLSVINTSTTINENENEVIDSSVTVQTVEPEMHSEKEDYEIELEEFDQKFLNHKRFMRSFKWNLIYSANWSNTEIANRLAKEFNVDRGAVLGLLFRYKSKQSIPVNQPSEEYDIWNKKKREEINQYKIKKTRKVSEDEFRIYASYAVAGHQSGLLDRIRELIKENKYRNVTKALHESAGRGCYGCTFYGHGWLNCDSKGATLKLIDDRNMFIKYEDMVFIIEEHLMGATWEEMSERISNYDFADLV